MRSIVVAGRQLRVAVRHGRGTRVPLLLFNGIGASLDLLEPFVDALDPALDVIRFDVPGVGGSPLSAVPYRFGGLCRLTAQMLDMLGYDEAVDALDPALDVIRFDVPGVGGSPLPAVPYRFGGLCRLTAAMLDLLGYDEAVDVLGISWGGGVAQHFAYSQRQRCRRLVLVATATGAIMVPARPEVLVQMVTPRRYLDPGYLQRVAPTIYGGSARTAPDRVRALMHDHSRVGSPRGYLYQLGAGAGWTSVPFLPLLRQPTLILAGDDDPLIPLANARLLRLLIPNSRLHIYNGGHLSLVTEASELAPVVDKFLAAADASSPRSSRREP